jgi:hypothetical protein
MYVVYHIREDFGRRKLALVCLLWYNLSRETVFSTNQDRQIRRDPHKVDILVLVKDRTTRHAWGRISGRSPAVGAPMKNC